MKYITYTLTALIFAVSIGAFAAPQQAQAACNYNGYYNSRGQCVYSYTSNTYRQRTMDRQITMLEDRAEYIESLLQRIYALLDELREERDSDDPWDPPYDGRSDVDVVTRSATNIEEDEATLRGEVDFNNEDEATVYFEYGKSSSNLKYDTTHLVLDEDDDDEDYQQIITDLDEDTKYYFRAVAEDENGDEDYGKILSFRTDENGSSSNNDDYPEVDVDSATNITDDSAKLRGEVDMNDFKNGLVFFVYGEDEDQVDDIADDYDTYSEVDEDGDDLQKIRIDYDLDTDATFYANVSGLNDDTDIYFNLCVEFEDEDDDDRIVCGDTEDFTTDD